MKLMILDGNSIVNRAYYGIRMLNAPDGTPTNGIYGFIAILSKLLDEEKPDALCVAFDLSGPTFRHKMFDGYKATRKGMPEELAVQMPLLRGMLDAMGIKRYELDGYEADDILGTVSRLCEEKGWQCRVVTGDRDSLQLASDKTTVKLVRTRMGRTETSDYNEAVFGEEYGFAPEKLIDLKSLMGDSSDNIPGVAGVGEKTALDLIRRFGSLDAALAAAADPESELKPAVRKKLEAGAESARMSYTLAEIDRDVPMDFSPDDALWDREYTPELYDVFMRLGFRKFIDKFGLTAPENPAEPEVFQGECTTERLTCAAEVAAAAAGIGDSLVCIYCEAGLDRVVVEESEGTTAWLLFRDFYADDYDEALKTLLGGGIKKAGHDIKDIQRELLACGVPAENWVFDTALAAYLLDATAGSYDIDTLTMKYCSFRPMQGVDDGQMSLLTDEASTVSHMASNAAAIACLKDVLEKKLAELGMDSLYYDIELPLCRVLADMETAGFAVDRAALSGFGESLTGSIDALQQSIWSHADGEFNINSPKQLGNVLFERLMLPAGKKTKTGWSTNADVLEKLRDKHPIVNEVLEYRTLAKLKSTYADGLLKVIGGDGRIHTNFKMTVTATGRLSSTEPNLQNIPVRTELGREMRKMFVAGDGMVLVDADYSQIELRILAHISGDERMKEAFLSGEDIHTVTASQVFGVPPEEVTQLQRSRAKAVNFGIVYGISAFSLAQDIGVYQSEAKAYMDAYLEKYSGVRRYMKEIVEKAKGDGYVSTEFGRRRYLPELKSSNYNMRSFGERVALNMPVQGTAADVIKRAMVRVYDRLKSEGLRARLIMQVHDELIAECPEQEAQRVTEILSQEMEAAAGFSVPLTAEAHTGRSWYEAK